MTEIKNQIKLYLIENIYDQFEARIMDLPPIFPQVKIHTFIGVDNQIMFLFNKNIGTVKQREVIIKQTDLQVFTKSRISQDLDFEQELEFGGDDVIKKYQIFKTAIPPESYKSFDNATLIEKSTLSSAASDPTKRPSSASYLDKIRPNTKYYYTFRCIDIHDHISNPTPVYQVEIINENGTIYPIVQEYKFPERQDYQETKNVKRFLMIKTDALQDYMQIKSDGITKMQDFLSNKDNNINLGIKEIKPYGKMYKLRLVSKSSKKVYDFELKFGKTIETIE